MNIGQNLSDSWTTYQTTTVDEDVAFDVPFVCMDSGNPAVDGGYRFDPDFLAYLDTCYQGTKSWGETIANPTCSYTARPRISWERSKYGYNRLQKCWDT